MSKKNKPNSPFPEMDGLLAGMEDLLRDENGNALTPDHPEYQKISTLMGNMVNSLNSEENKNQTEGPQGHA